MSTLTQSEAVTFYAARVRASLHGLAPDVVDDLTDGLEADITESILDELELTDGGPAAALGSIEPEALEERFGAPATYAAELASAAGVALIDDDAAAESRSAPTRRRSLREGAKARRERVEARVAAYVAEHPWAAATLSFLGVLRPVWWVARGWAWYVVIAAALGGEPLWREPNAVGWFVLLGSVVLSVQWGRGRVLQGRWGRRLLVLLGAVAVITLLIAYASGPLGRSGPSSNAGGSWDSGFTAGWEQGVDEAMAGVGNSVIVDGQRATNLFVFDAAGNPIEQAQLVDQNGRPVVIGPADGYLGTWEQWANEGVGWTEFPVPVGVLEGKPLNVFPYSFVAAEDVQFSAVAAASPRPGAATITPRWPAASLLPVPGYGPAGGPASGAETLAPEATPPPESESDEAAEPETPAEGETAAG